MYTKSALRLAFISTSIATSRGLSTTVNRGRILVLGGSGYLGSEVAKRAVANEFSVTSLSRRGRPAENAIEGVDYVTGDATDENCVNDLVSSQTFDAVVHCIGLLFDADSGLAQYNVFVSGSGSVIKDGATYDDITRKTAIHAIEAAEKIAKEKNTVIPFIFTSAAEAGWLEGDMQPGGKIMDSFLAPDWLKRYLSAKRSVEARLNESGDQNILRPVIFRPSLIFSYDRLASLPPVGAFFVGNKIGLPFVDRPVTVQNLANAMVSSVKDDSVRCVQRYSQIDKLS